LDRDEILVLCEFWLQCVSDRLEQHHRLADRVQRDCRATEDLLDNVERKLNEVVCLPLHLMFTCCVCCGLVPQTYTLYILDAVAHIAARLVTDLAV